MTSEAQLQSSEHDISAGPTRSASKWAVVIAGVIGVIVTVSILALVIGGGSSSTTRASTMFAVLDEPQQSADLRNFPSVRGVDRDTVRLAAEVDAFQAWIAAPTNSGDDGLAVCLVVADVATGVSGLTCEDTRVIESRGYGSVGLQAAGQEIEFFFVPDSATPNLPADAVSAVSDRVQVFAL